MFGVSRPLSRRGVRARAVVDSSLHDRKRARGFQRVRGLRMEELEGWLATAFLRIRARARSGRDPVVSLDHAMTRTIGRDTVVQEHAILTGTVLLVEEFFALFPTRLSRQWYEFTVPLETMECILRFTPKCEGVLSSVVHILA